MLQSIHIEIINLIILCTGFFGVVLAIGDTFIQKKSLLNLYSIGLYLSVGLALIVDYVNHGQFFPLFPHFAYVNDCLEFFMGAFFYHFFRSLLFPEARKKTLSLLLFVPALINLALYVPFFMLPAAYKASHYPIEYIGNTPLGTWYGFINRSVELWVVFCIAAFIVRFTRSYGVFKEIVTEFEARTPLNALFRYSVEWGIALLLFFVTNFLPWPVAQRLVILACSILALELHFILQKHQAFFLRLRAGMTRNGEGPREELNAGNSGAKTRLQGLDLGVLMRRLERLMTDARLYRDAELNVNGLASRLGIKPWQLSEMLNQELKANFRNYLNDRRLEEVKARLLSEPDRTILDIAFECGFNSKATFNAAFTKSVGMTPSKYRKQGQYRPASREAATERS